MITKIGIYYLDQPVEEAPKLKEYTWGEYTALEFSGYRKILKDERIYKGDYVGFCNGNWETILSATEGRIYRISLNNLSMDRYESDKLFKSVRNQLIKEMGNYSEHAFLSNKYIWNTSQGNVILDRMSKCGYRGINVMLTSRSIAQQMLNMTNER